MSNEPPSFNLIVETGPQSGHVFVVWEGSNSIGRDPVNDICLPDPSVSRNHARLVVQPEGAWIEDLGSTNGTFVNGRQITTSAWLKPEDTLQIGSSITLKVSQPADSDEIEELGGTLVPSMGMPSPTPASVHLVVQQGPQPGQTFQLLSGSQTIGRASDNQIIIADPTISKQHAQIVVQPGGVLIQDLDSSNGTFVNGQRIVTSVWLQPNDKVQVGTWVTLNIQAIQPGQTPFAVTPHSRRQVRPLWVIAAVAIALILGGLAVAWFFLWSLTLSRSGPSILVYEPELGGRTGVNAPLIIKTGAQDERRVSRVELWVNDELVAAELSKLPDGQNPFFFITTWAPPTSGEHKFFARAYSTDKRLGQSNVVGINAIQVSSESDKLVQVTEEGDTLESIAQDQGVSAEDIVDLNPIIRVVADVQGVPPTVIELPPDVPIQVPSHSNYVVQEGDTLDIVAREQNISVYDLIYRNPIIEDIAAGQNVPPAKAELPPDLSIEVPSRANLERSRPPLLPNQAPQGDNDESPQPVTSCSTYLPPKVEKWKLVLQNVRLDPPNLPLENTYCHISIGPQTGSKILWHQKLSDSPSIDFEWPPAGLMPIQFTCLVEGESSTDASKPSRDLGTVQHTLDEAVWLGGQIVSSRAHNIWNNSSIYLQYQICPADGPCQWKPDVGANLSVPYNLNLTNQVLNWEWQPQVSYLNQPVCFEIREQVHKEGTLLTEQVINIDLMQVFDLNIISREAMIEELKPGCNMEVTYYVRAVGREGVMADSDLYSTSALQGPPCPVTVRVDFDTVEVQDPAAGWGPYRVHLYVNEQKREWNGFPLPKSPPYKYQLSDFFLNQENVFKVQLNEEDDLTIGAVIYNEFTGFLCQGNLPLPRMQAGEWKIFPQEPVPIDMGQCKIEVRVTGI